MALQTSTGYVRITDVGLGADNKTLRVDWLTFHNSNWQENNPRRVWQGIIERGSNTFDLAIKEKQLVPVEPYQNQEGELVTHEEQDVVMGYKPQTIEQAHEELRNLSGKDCNFKGVNFQVVDL